MKIGIFGDSFAVYYPEKAPRTAWATVLEDKFKWDVTNYAWGATSLFWTYTQLLNNINDVDIVIMSITQQGRLYSHDPKACTGLSNYGSVNARLAGLSSSHADYEILNAALQYFVHLSNDDFNRYVHVKIIDDIKKLCNLQGKRLILIPGFDEDINSQDIFQSALINVSVTECWAHFKQPYVIEAPTRNCHMTDANNSILAQLLDQILRGNRTEVKLNDFNFEKISDLSSQWILP